jgi:predicted heme/steroid binding protein
MSLLCGLFTPKATRSLLTQANTVLQNPQISLTDAELLKYDGTNPDLPIYLALNGTIYDVSANRGTYGPGGSYHFFAGRDAARAFLTGCFQEDQTADLRGVEEMYMPIDPPEEDFGVKIPGQEEDPTVQAHKDAKAHDKRRPQLSKAEIKNRHAQELRQAKKMAREGLEHWHKLFRGDKGKPYFKVGEVKREKDWLKGVPKRELCDQAKKGRPVRKAEGAA